MTLLYPMALVVVLYLIMLAYRYIEEYLERRRITRVFGRYVAPQIVDHILKGGEESLKLGGTRREITALFVDIRGFTPMYEKIQPEQVVEILNDYLNLTASSIFKYGGTLDKFIGDATMAIFNAPLDLYRRHRQHCRTFGKQCQAGADIDEPGNLRVGKGQS